jgi:hypothetical protein
MAKKHAQEKPKAVWVGSTPITLLTPKESRELHRRIRQRREELRQRYPEVRGKIVDFISHSIEDGTLFFTVAFKHRTSSSLRFACQMFLVGTDFGDMKTGDLKVIREYMKPILW